MINTLAHIYRRPDISRDQFRAHYESRHTRLAKRLLPNFDYYVRNHMIETTAPERAPDVISEFIFNDDNKLATTLAILSDDRGREILDDELTFMDKPRNELFTITRTPRLPTTVPHKYVLLLRGDVAALPQWQAAWQSCAADLSHTLLCSDVNSKGANQLHWLFGWSRSQQPIDQLQRELLDRELPIVWSARVSEHVGYPD